MMKTTQSPLAGLCLLAGAVLAAPAAAGPAVAPSYAALTVDHPEFSYGPAGSIEVTLRFAFGAPQLEIDPAALHLRMRRVDAGVRPWTTLAPSAAASAASGSAALVRISGVRGATYEFSLEAAQAVEPVGSGPPASAVSDGLNAFTEFHDPGLPAHDIWLLTIPSDRVVTPDIALQRVRRTFSGSVATVTRGGLTLRGDYGSPHAPPYAEALTPGDRLKIGPILRGTAEMTSTGPLGVPAKAGISATTARYAMDAIHVTVERLVSVAHPTGEAPQDALWLTFASPDEMRLYLR